MWGSKYTNSRGRIIADWCEKHSLCILNNGEPTYLGHKGKFSCIDITICSDNIAANFSWQPYHDSLNSDHFPININSTIEINNIPPKPRWLIKRADSPKYQDSLKLPENFLSTTQACGTITNEILRAANKQHS